MILRLSSPADRILLAPLAPTLATALSCSGIRKALAVRGAEPYTPESCLGAMRREPEETTNWYLLGCCWQYNLEESAEHTQQ
jgi:hypothetical protein